MTADQKRRLAEMLVDELIEMDGLVDPAANRQRAIEIVMQTLAAREARARQQEPK